jgi:hypothetical protein
MPHYPFFCRDYKKAFLKTVTIARHEKEKIAVDHHRAVPTLRDDNAVSRRSPAFIFEQKS